jgi:hypothetical protein
MQERNDMAVPALISCHCGKRNDMAIPALLSCHGEKRSDVAIPNPMRAYRGLPRRYRFSQ